VVARRQGAPEPGDSGCPATHAELLVEVLEVLADGAGRDAEQSGDLGVRVAGREAAHLRSFQLGPDPVVELGRKPITCIAEVAVEQAAGACGGELEPAVAAAQDDAAAVVLRAMLEAGERSGEASPHTGGAIEAG
jgi:hypothetical protein